jgi:hypothetical protein
MPAIADIVVKKNDNTTNITYTGVQPSSGDGTAATWKSQSVGASLAFQPELRLSARSAQNGTAREFTATYMYPQIKTDTTTGVTSIHRKAMGKVTWVYSQDMSATDEAEASAQFVNLLASALVRNCFNSGYSAT